MMMVPARRSDTRGRCHAIAAAGAALAIAIALAAGTAPIASAAPAEAPASAPALHASRTPQEVALAAASAFALHSTQFIPRFHQNTSFAPPIWTYGGAIVADAIYEVVDAFEGRGDAAAAATAVLESTVSAWLDVMKALPGTYGYNVLHNVSMPPNAAVGDQVGLFPIAYLDRYNRAVARGGVPPVSDLTIVQSVVDTYVVGYPNTLPDAARTFSRLGGWPSQPPTGNATFLWGDDQYMGLTPMARLASQFSRRDLIDRAAAMQLSFAQYLRDNATGLYWHGFNVADMTPSCCMWGRANGWAMMSHAEVLLALQAFPGHPLQPQVLALLQAQVKAALPYQVAGDGRWRNLINNASMWPETSVTAMFVTAMGIALEHGWLDVPGVGASGDGAVGYAHGGGVTLAEQVSPALSAAWAGVAAAVLPDGNVTGVCEGTGIQDTAQDYLERGTEYFHSGPGGAGMVLRAAVVMDRLSRRGAVAL